MIINIYKRSQKKIQPSVHPLHLLVLPHGKKITLPAQQTLPITTFPKFVEIS